MQPNQNIRYTRVGAGATVRVWDKPTSIPVRQLSIFLSSLGAAFPAGGVSWRVYYGGTWSGGQPFDEDATLTGGISQANGAVGAAESASVIYNTTDLLPANQRVDPLPWGPAYSVEIINSTASTIYIAVIFISRSLTGQN